MAQILCLNCGNSFEKTGQNHKFCSYKCNTQHQRIKQKTMCRCGKPKDAASKKCRFCFDNDKKIVRICETCKTEFKVRQSTIRYNAARFCSPECYIKSRTGIKRPEHSQCLKTWWKTHPDECKKAKERGLLLASDKAYLEKLSELSSGDKNHAWRGGIANRRYKGFYQKLKDKIRLRDNYTCQLCGKTEVELQYTLSINHIDFDKENSLEENLNALCKRCNSLINFDRELWTKHFQDKIVNTNLVGK